MPQVLKRPQAGTDLDEIWWYIAQDDPDNADRFLEKIEERTPEAIRRFKLKSVPVYSINMSDDNLLMGGLS